MNARFSCPRKWQVEAASDGRLSGKDLAHAARHRAQCRECADEEQALAELKRRCASLPPRPRDPLTVRRTRQRLMATLNQTLLAATLGPRPNRPGSWAVLGLLLAAALATAFCFAQVKRATPPLVPAKSVMDIHAVPGARWLVHSEPELDRAELSDGTAVFEVHPHPGRRVLVMLPDGELEDLGTTFEVTVQAGKTEQIRVSRGRVLVRLAGQPEFSLAAGARWQRAAVPVAKARVPSPELAAQVTLAAPRRARMTREKVPSAPSAPSAVPSAPLIEADSDTTGAEDTAYLSIVSALHQQRYAEARSQAKAYLLQFPNGFRRVEVLNVATSGDRSGALP